jgi:hypothetical protein
MSRKPRGLLVLLVPGVLLTGGVAVGRAVDKGHDQVDNPRYRFWASFKPGATSTYTQTTKFHGPEKASAPGGVEKKTITYRLLSVDKDKAVVLTTVVEEDFLSTVESAPTRITYPAKVKKANLPAFLEEWNTKEGEGETIKVGGKDVKCKVRGGTQKTEGGTVDAKMCHSDAVPRGVVLHTRTTKDGDTVVAETTTALVKSPNPLGGQMVTAAALDTPNNNSSEIGAAPVRAAPANGRRLACQFSTPILSLLTVARSRASGVTSPVLPRRATS